MLPTFIFADTSAWYAYVDKMDTHHPAATQFIGALTTPLVTSTYILDETVTRQFALAKNCAKSKLLSCYGSRKTTNREPGRFSYDMRTKGLALPIAHPLP